MTSAARALRPVEQDGRPAVWVEDEPHAIRTLTALVDRRGIPDTYVQDGELVVPVSGTAPAAGDGDAPLPLAASRISPARLAALLAEHVEVIEPRAVDKGWHAEVPVTPSHTVRSAVLSHRHWPGLPALRGLISAPVLRGDGTLLQDPGCDPATGYYLTTRTRMPRIPRRAYSRAGRCRGGVPAR